MAARADTHACGVRHVFRVGRNVPESALFPRAAAAGGAPSWPADGRSRFRLVAGGLGSQYPWCSAGWFEQTVPPAQVKVIYSFRVDRVNVDDDFDVEAEL